MFNRVPGPVVIAPPIHEVKPSKRQLMIFNVVTIVELAQP